MRPSRLLEVTVGASLLAVLVAIGMFVSVGVAAARPAAHRTAAKHYVGKIAPSGAASEVDCNGWSKAYKPARPMMRELCTDPIQIRGYGKTYRFVDNGHYVGHDEPSVKFLSSAPGSGNAMTYYMQLPLDPGCTPDATATCTKYGELSPAPWFGLPMCDPHSYPLNPCKPDSDSNSGAITDPNGAGSAFMELQFYPPGFTPFMDNQSCSATHWCSALNIDSLECTFNFASCNLNCEEPVNFAYLQRDGVPNGPAAPQDPNISTYVPNGQTLQMNPGDVLEVSITDPPGGFTTTVHDLTTGQTGFMQASAANGFANTNMSDCSGNPFTWHAEYSTAAQQNQVPWAALEGGVLMEQEIGHGESCGALANTDPVSTTYIGGNSYSDPSVTDTCVHGLEGPTTTGEGPCNSVTGICTASTTEGPGGPVACPSNNFNSPDLCEYADGSCFPAGSRAVTINGSPATASEPLNFCTQGRFENGDLDYEGNSYIADWPNGSSSFPTSIRYAGPYTTDGKPYPNAQFESDAPGSESLCDVSTGTGCQVPPIGGGGFYPFWSLNNTQTIAGSPLPSGACVWDFGNDIAGTTLNDFGRFAQYGTPDVARYGGTVTSPVMGNPELASGCKLPTNTSPPTVAGTAEQGKMLSATNGSWSNSPTSFSYQWIDCDASGNNCSPIAGATGQTYTLTASDVGHTVRVAVTANNGADSQPAQSARTAVVTEAPPSNTALPTIYGDTSEGQTLFEAHGTWANNPTSYSYQWFDCDSSGKNCSLISGAAAQAYTLTASDVGHTIVVRETATNSTGSTAASSAVTPVVQSITALPTKPAASSPPVISGVGRVGATLSSTTGLWSGTPTLTYAYQWQRCNPGCTNITGATGSSYTVTSADFGARVVVVVAAKDLYGSANMTSGQVGPIGPSVAQIKKLLGKLLVPHGKAARILRLLRKGGYPFSFTTPGAGQLIVTWTRGRQVIATVTVTLGKARKVKSVVLLTAKGAKVLIGSHKSKLTARGTFTPSSLPGTTVTKKVTLKR